MTTVGTDTQTYISIFREIGLFKLNYLGFWKFPVYSFYNLFLYQLNSSDYTIIVANSIVVVGLFCVICKKISISPYFPSILFVLLYYYFSSMNGSRQYISILLSIYAVILFRNESKKAYILLAVSIAVHVVSIITISYLVLFKVDWNIKKYTVLGVLTVIGSLFIEKIMYIFSRVFDSYETYLTSNSATNINTIGGGNKVVLSVFLGIFVVMGLFVISRNFDKKDPLFRFFVAMGLISTILDIMFINNLLMIRIILYFNIWFIFLIPTSIYHFSKLFKEKNILRICVSFFTVIILFIPYYYQLSHNMANVLPYKTFLIK